MSEYSVSPAGEEFPIPSKNEYTAEFERIESLVKAARQEGKEIHYFLLHIAFVHQEDGEKRDQADHHGRNRWGESAVFGANKIHPRNDHIGPTNRGERQA